MENRPTASPSSQCRWLSRVALALCCLAPLPGLAAVDVNASGNHATASVDLGTVEADVSLGFSAAENLGAATLGLDATLLDLLALDLDLLQRLGTLGSSALNSAFPMLLSVDPSGLAFSDTVVVEVHTHNLEYAAGSRLRLFKSTDGGLFHDITVAVEAGSVRTRGRTGGFSDFVVLLDLRPTSDVVREKFDRVGLRLADATGLSLIERSSLENHLQQSRSAFALGQPATAIAALDRFDLELRTLSGVAIPNRWSAGGGQDNIAGDLQAGVATLRFSLGYLRDFGD